MNRTQQERFFTMKREGRLPQPGDTVRSLAGLVACAIHCCCRLASAIPVAKAFSHYYEALSGHDDLAFLRRTFIEAVEECERASLMSSGYDRTMAEARAREFAPTIAARILADVEFGV